MLVLSKIGWLLVQPISLIVILLLVAFAMVAAGWRRRGMTVLGVTILLLFASAYTSVGYMLIAPLEARFTRPAQMPAQVDGIVLLGGGMDWGVGDVRNGYEMNRSGDRVTEALWLALQYPQAKIAITGGTTVLMPGPETEAVAMARFFLDFGISAERLIVEDAARNTDENAKLTLDLADPQPGETWLLVTSAFHMPRSVGIFRKVGFAAVPWPADYFAETNEGFSFRFDQPAENLSITSIAIREWLGLVAYWITGRTDALVPAP